MYSACIEIKTLYLRKTNMLMLFKELTCILRIV
jgi:hypothetical protein